MVQSSIGLKPQIVRAGAGTGKTTCLISEVFEVYKLFKSKEKKDPHLIVCTFTKKATQELKERLYKKAIEEQNWAFLDYVQSPFLSISTIDSLLTMFLKNYSYKYGLTPDFTLEDFTREQELFNQLCEKYLFEKHPSLLERMKFFDLQEALRFYVNSKLKYKNISFYDEKDFKEFNQAKEKYSSQNKKELLEENKEELKIIKDTGEEGFESQNFTPYFQDFKNMANDFFIDYLKIKKREGCLTMNDLPLFSLDLLRNHPSVAQSFSNEWDYWFIDEYQDTSWIQEQIVQQITGFKNVFCVGDPKQSIYLFRDADPGVFKRREDSLKKDIKTLDTNYRSNSSLIHFFNDFFPVKEGYLSFQPPEGKSGGKKECISFLNYSDKDQAFYSTYSYIQTLIDEGCDLKDIAILSSNNDSLNNVASFLKEEGLSCHLHSSSGFSDNRLILDALFLFKFLMNPHDNTNLVALLRTPYFLIKDQEIADLCFSYKKRDEGQKRESLWMHLQESSKSKRMICLKNYLKQIKEQGLIKTFEQALMEQSYIDLSHLQDPSGSSESNLWKLLFLLHDSKSPLDLFYSFMDDEEQSEGSFKEAVSFFNSDAIQLMTIHKSKGLEFKHVIIFDFSIGNALKGGDKKQQICAFDVEKSKMTFAIPVGNRHQKKIKNYGHRQIVSKERKKKIQERDRLFYVAMTRAQESLAFLIPSGKIEKPSWLNGVAFFDSFKHIRYKDDKPTSGIQTWCLKEGVYDKKNYSFIVRDNFKYVSSKKSEQKIVNLLSPLKNRNNSKKPLIVKSSQDFLPGKKQEDIKKEKKIIYPQLKNQIFKMNLGNHLHFYLRLLAKHSLESVLSQLEQSSLSLKEIDSLRQGLKYIDDLKKPSFQKIRKKGYPEWAFKFKKDLIVLQGQIDFWAWEEKNIWLFDYKSSRSQEVKNQLIFYSWVLKEMYPVDDIFMCGVYPLESHINIEKYEQKHSAQMEEWLGSF